MVTEQQSETLLAYVKHLVACDTRVGSGMLSKEEGIFAFLEDQLSGFELDFVAESDTTLGLLAMRGSRPKHLLCVHLETGQEIRGWSHDPFTLRVQNGEVLGLGVANCKGGAGALLTALQDTSEDVAVLFTLDLKQYNNMCASQFLASSLRSKLSTIEFVFCIEPTCGAVVTEHRGLVQCTGYFNGVSGHGAQARVLVDSAIHEAMRWGMRALDFAGEHQRHTYYDSLKGIYFNIGLMEGGNNSNMIADHAVVKWTVRPLPEQEPMYVAKQICELASRPWRVRWEYQFNGPTLPARGSAEKTAEIIDRTREYLSSYALLLGSAVDFWTPASIFSQAGFLAAALGPGHIAQSDAPDERVKLSELEQSVCTFMRLIDGVK